MPDTTTPPCVGHATLYDALFDDEQPEQRAAAQQQAAALCATCPTPCPQKVTASSPPRTSELLDEEWLPPSREGRPEPQVPKTRTWSAERRAGAAFAVGRAYIKPQQRPAAWARMAAGLAAEGRTPTQIADALCVSTDTVHLLLAQSDIASRKAA